MPKLLLKLGGTSATPMSGKAVLLDTNIVVAHFRKPGTHDQALNRHELHLPYVVAAELYAGALRSQKPEQNRELIDTFLESASVLACDLDTAKRYAVIWSELAGKGSPIPQNDIWIAALAVQHELPLVTNDSHFQHIDDLDLITW